MCTSLTSLIHIPSVAGLTGSGGRARRRQGLTEMLEKYVVPPPDVGAGSAHCSGSHQATAAGSEESKQLRGVLAYVEARADGVKVRASQTPVDATFHSSAFPIKPRPSSGKPQKPLDRHAHWMCWRGRGDTSGASTLGPTHRRIHDAAKPTKRCSDGGEDQGAEEA